MIKINKEATIGNILWQSSIVDLENYFISMGSYYENTPKYIVKRLYEDNILKGVYIYHEFENIRYIDEIAYTGNNKFKFIKIYKDLINTDKNIVATVLKNNIRMQDFYLNKLKFVVINDDGIKYTILLKRGG